ncbi:MAG: alpha/beta hydrolase family protein [Phenylobacterium sp.]
MPRFRNLLAAAALFACASGAARAEAVGERHLTAVQPSAALRDAAHRTELRITVWYPAPDGVDERSLDLGPPDKPLFLVGSAAPDAPFADARRRPAILFSHGFGGTARMMAWFTTNLARVGFVVVAVDHPGNNGLDKMTAPGAVMFWDRPEDLRVALAAVKADPVIGPHVDMRRVGAAGFSAGGFTALAAAGAKVDIEHFLAFCKAHPEDGVCKPQKEFPITVTEAMKSLDTPELQAELAHSGDDHSIREVRAAFAIAPAIVQAFDPAGLAAIKTPVAIILGDSDPIAPPNTNGGVAARAIPGAELKVLARVGHYDFLSMCTPSAMVTVDLCGGLKTPQGPTHEAALGMAYGFFVRTLGRP